MIEEIIFAREPLIRAVFFFGVFALMGLWELLAPTRQASVSKKIRWTSNLGLVVLNTLLLRAVFPLAAVGFAGVAAEHGWGLFHVVDLPGWTTVLFSIVILDLAVYLHHVMFHALPTLWRLHAVHHADRDFDVTTGLRFHPIEIFLSMGIKIAAIALIGAPAIAVLLFEIVLNATAMFNHGNVNLPPGLDRLVRLIVVTPNMHRVHHSVIIRETNSNYGFALPWWDYLFGTHRRQPAHGHVGMRIGMANHQRTMRVAHRPWMLLFPFARLRKARHDRASGS